MSEYPKETKKKVVLLKYFRNYMNEHLVKAGAAMKPREGDELSRIPSLRAWFRSRSAIVLHMTNGTLQVGCCCFSSGWRAASGTMGAYGRRRRAVKWTRRLDS